MNDETDYNSDREISWHSDLHILNWHSANFQLSYMYM